MLRQSTHEKVSHKNNQWSAKRKAPMKDYLTAINKTYSNHIGAIIYAKLL